jgi:hypothetical protein
MGRTQSEILKERIRSNLKRRVRQREIMNTPEMAEELALLGAQEEIAHAMKVEGVSNRDLAEDLGVRLCDVVRILTSGNGLSIKKLGKIMHVLGYEIRFHSKKRKMED